MELIYALPPKINRKCTQFNTPKSPIKKILISIEKLNPRELSSLLVYTHRFTPTSQKHFKKLFETAWTGNRFIYYHVW